MRKVIGESFGKKWLLGVAVFLLSVTTVFAIPFKQEVEASSGSIKVTQLTWGNKNVDSTLWTGSKNLVLKVKATNRVAGSNYLDVTIQDVKTKKKMTQRISKNGGTLYYKVQPGNYQWKVLEVKAVKVAEKSRQWIPGKWLGGQYIAGRYSITYTTKTLRKAALSAAQKKNVCKVVVGDKTKVALSGIPASQLATKNNIKITATLKNSKGKALSGKTVQLIANSGSVQYSKKVKTNAKGIATATVNVPKETKNLTHMAGFKVTAKFAGEARKHRAVSASKSVTQPKEATKFSGKIEWDGHTGKKMFTMRVLTNSGQAVANGPLEWKFAGVQNVSSLWYTTTKTTKNGYANAFLTMDKEQYWNDYKVTVTPTYAWINLPYKQPAVYEQMIYRKSDELVYQVDTSKLQLWANGYEGRVPWLSPNLTQITKKKIELQGSKGVFHINGQQISFLSGAEVMNDAYVSIIALNGSGTYSCGNPAHGNKCVVHEKQIGKNNLRLLSDDNYFLMNLEANSGMAQPDITSVRIEMKLPIIGKYGASEYVYKPVVESISVTMP